MHKNFPKKSLCLTVYSVYNVSKMNTGNISIYKGWLKNSLDNIISAVDNFLIYRIQTLQHWFMKCMNCKGDYIEK